MIIDFFPASVRGGIERRKLIEKAESTRGFTDDYSVFGRDYFDNPDLGVGYGNYAYDGRFADVAKTMIEHYGLQRGDRVLEVGCAKGFVLVEFQKLGMEVEGLDASAYAVEHAHPDLQGHVRVGDVCALPFPDDSFDLVLSKEMLPHVPEDQVRKAVQECMRVSKGPIFLEIQCGRTEKELEYMKRWDGTHKTMRTPEWWNALFAEIGYEGDVHYKVLIPEDDSSFPQHS